MAALNLCQIVRPVAATKPQAGLAPVTAPVKAAKKAVLSNVTTRSMQVWTPYDNKYFETLSFLPPLTSEQIAKQVDYIVGNGWTPCLEFADAEHAYVGSGSCVRFHDNGSVNYVDNRYWTMWKLPMFGCNDASQVLGEIQACEKCYPDVYIRLVAFDAVRQVQITGFLVHRPASASDFRAPLERSVS